MRDLVRRVVRATTTSSWMIVTVLVTLLAEPYPPSRGLSEGRGRQALSSDCQRLRGT